MESNLFRFSLIFSCFVHAIVLTNFSYSNIHYLNRPLKEVEVTYFKLKVDPKKFQTHSQKQEGEKHGLQKGTEVLLAEKSQSSALIKDISKLLDKLEAPQKKPTEISKLQTKRKVSVPPLKTEKINNPLYVSYYQLVRNKIKERAYMNYARFDVGEVYLTFAVSSNGGLKQVQLIEEKTSANSYLKEISLQSIQESNPFPPFPEDLKYPELTFNVVISFELED